MNRIALAVACLSLLGAATDVFAQGRLGFEVSGGAAVATEDLGDADLGIGLGFEVALVYRLASRLGVYGAWNWHRFSSDESFAGQDVDFEETGYAFGLRYYAPLRGDSSPFVHLRAGGTYNHIEVEDGEGVSADSGHGLGWEAGAGISFPIGVGWHLTPGARYRSLSRELTIGDVTTEVDLNYIALEIAFSRWF